ncbi:MAG: Sec-independent protein translocase subunit TatA/TatB [Phycisphaerales bacterium]
MMLDQSSALGGDALGLSGSVLAFLGLPGQWEWVIILLIGLLLFGRRLPEVGRSIGRSIVEFKKGVKGIEDEVDGATRESERRDGEQRRLSGTDTRATVDPGMSSGEARTIPTVDPGMGSGSSGGTSAAGPSGSQASAH